MQEAEDLQEAGTTAQHLDPLRRWGDAGGRPNGGAQWDSWMVKMPFERFWKAHTKKPNIVKEPGYQTGNKEENNHVSSININILTFTINCE